MAILIVDDEPKTREALRYLLHQLDYKVIVEAKNGEEAIKVAQSKKTRIKFILADLEMPYMDGLALLEKVKEVTYLDLTPFLLITSDLLRAQIAEYQNKLPRLDGYLVKPFRVSALAEAMRKAYRHRCLTRSQLVVVGQAIPPFLSEAMQVDDVKNSFWSDLKLIAPSQLPNFLTNLVIPYPSLILIQTTLIDESEKKRLSDILLSFKKTPLGSITPIGCLSREPSQVFHFRTLCHYFWEPQNEYQTWLNLLSVVQNGILTEWDTDLLFQTAKKKLQNKELPSALKTAEKMLKLNQNNSDIHCITGDILNEMKRSTAAMHHYQTSIDLNPTLPGPYIKLLNILMQSDRQAALELAESAVQFCPQNHDINNMQVKISL